MQSVASNRIGHHGRHRDVDDVIAGGFAECLAVVAKEAAELGHGVLSGEDVLSIFIDDNYSYLHSPMNRRYSLHSRALWRAQYRYDARQPASPVRDMGLPVIDPLRAPHTHNKP